MELARHKSVASVHDLHIWTLSGSRVALSAHLMVHDLSRWDQTLGELQEMLRERYRIEHVTLQPESAARSAVPLPLPRRGRT
jgi:cobalt-zinc-cadmium efflux system protein